MKAWWQQLNARQQRVILAAAAIAGLVVVWTGVWEPLADSRAQYRAQVAEQTAIKRWLESAAPLARQLQADGGEPRGFNGRSLIGVVDQSARASGLAGALNRIDPAGDDQVRVRLDGADFRQLMAWLETLVAERPVRIEQLDAERADTPGRVNARVTLESLQ